MDDVPREVELIIRFRGSKFLLLFVPAVALIALSVYLNPEGWRGASPALYLTFAGLGLFVLFIAQLLPQRHVLHLTHEGLTIH